jgi:hypothetical protein
MNQIVRMKILSSPSQFVKRRGVNIGEWEKVTGKHDRRAGNIPVATPRGMQDRQNGNISVATPYRGVALT